MSVIQTENINYYYLILAFLLLFVNWGIETIKWKKLIDPIADYSFSKMFKAVFGGITMSIITPNRVGEIPGRALLLNNQPELKSIIVNTSLGSFSQLIATVLFGCIGMCFLYVGKSPFNLNGMQLHVAIILLISATLFCLMVYFKFDLITNRLQKIRWLKKYDLSASVKNFTKLELTGILLLSLIRYGIFCGQFYLVLTAFGIPISYENIYLIFIYFLVASLIPTILLSEIGVRGSVAIIVFGLISDNSLAILIASVSLWIINIGIPAILGLYSLKQLKLA